MTVFESRYRRVQMAPRTVVGFHGCSESAAERIISERQFNPSTRSYDWLGEGVYFWEYAPHRAMEWATEKCAVDGGTPVVLFASIRLGQCLNLLDTERMDAVARVHEQFIDEKSSRKMPYNTESGAHYLDREIIDYYCRTSVGRFARPIQTVRGSFAEGSPIYPGSKILRKAHTQIAVRDPVCIMRVSMARLT